MKIPNNLKKVFEIPLGKKLKISIWLIPTAFCAISGGYGKIFLFTYLSAMLHELAHIFCAKALGVDMSKITLYPFGISAKLKSGYIRSSEKEFFIALAGPFLSLILFWIFTALNKFSGWSVPSFAADANLALCAVNLIPALPLDGGRAFKAILTARYGILRAYNFMMKFSRLVILVLLGIAVIFFLISDFNFSLILISAFLLQNFCSEQRAVTTITLKEILSTAQKFKLTPGLPSKVLCVLGSRPASGILRHLSYDCFYIIHILDKDTKIIKILTETQVINALIRHGIRIRYEDI